jgi:hypothetical protein
VPILTSILRVIFHQICHFFDPILGDIILVDFCLPIQGGGRRGRFLSFLVIFGPPKTRFCYIVVSTFFGPSGPPPGHPFWTPFWKKYSLFVGNDVFIGSILGVKKGGSFCRKLQNFKKFHIWGPGPPRSIFDDFDPPAAYPFLSNFGSIFHNFIRGHFWSFFVHFWPPIFII